MNIKNKSYQNFQKLVNVSIKAKYLLLIFALVIVINICFLYTYPLNVASYDNPNYLIMIIQEASNLMHASGYPYVMMMGSKLFGITSPATIFGLDWHIKELPWYGQLQILQLFIHLTIMLVSMLLCAKNFGKLTAAIMIAFWGTSILFMSSVGSAAPEWLQGDVILLSMLMCSAAYFSRTISSKVILYTLSFMVLTAAYLIKYNSLLFYPIFVLIIIVDANKVSWKILTISIASLMSIGMVTVFINTFHFPTTKSKALNFDHAWVLTDAMPKDYFRAPLEEMGIHALRWRALSALLPPEYFRAAAFCCIDTGAPKESKDTYRPEYEKIMTASKEELINYIMKHETRKEFNNTVSAIPLYWYIGLPETDKLGVKVFNESIFKIPEYYIHKILKYSKKISMVKMQIVPFETETLGLKFVDSKYENSSFLKYKIIENTYGHSYLYWNPSELLWRPGVFFFEKLNYLTKSRFWEILISIVSVIGIFTRTNIKRRRLECIYLLSILIFLAASLTLAVRHKEIVSIFPVMALFIAMGFRSLGVYFYKKYLVR